MYVSEICAERICVTFPLVTKNVKSRSKIALFSNERHFEMWLSRKKTITFFWSNLSKLHKKDPILHVTTTFSLKQGETRTSSGPIPYPDPLKSFVNWGIGIYEYYNNVMVWQYGLQATKIVSGRLTVAFWRKSHTRRNDIHSGRSILWIFKTKPY